MSFSTTPRIFMLQPDDIPNVLADLQSKYGEDLPDGKSVVRTIGAHWDDMGQTKLRAAQYPVTCPPMMLTNGKVAFRCLWQQDAIEAFENGEYPQAQEITQQEFEDLLFVIL
jgi:hypothetical protein